MIRENQQLLNRLNTLLDGIIVFASVLLGYWFRFHVFSGIATVKFNVYVVLALAAALCSVCAYNMSNLYEPVRKTPLTHELTKLYRVNGLLFLILVVAFYLFKKNDFSRGALALFFIFENGGLTAKRMLLRFVLRSMRRNDYNRKFIVIVGGGELARMCINEIRENAEFGHEISGVVSNENTLTDVKFLGTPEEMEDILEKVRPDEVIAALEAGEYDELPSIIGACENSGIKFSLVPAYARYLPVRPKIDSLNGIPLLNLRRIPLDNYGNAFVKRLVDIVGSLILIILTSPLMLAAAIGVRLSSPGPVIFVQERMGKDRKIFKMYKFRSMRINARESTGWSRNHDDRKTPFGSFIRKYSIDELPQLFNVLKGDMSLVGPRPEVPFYVAKFRHEIPLYMVRHLVRPGITGWAQVNGLRGDTSIEDRIHYDVHYIENWTLLFDIQILFMTLGHISNKEVLVKAKSEDKSKEDEKVGV